MAPATSPTLPRRVLMVAYEFPPQAAGGVARTLRHARYLPAFGWQPHVLTVSNPPDGARDASVLSQLHPRARVHRSRSWEVHALRDPLVRLARALGRDEKRWREGLTWRLQRLWDLFAVPDTKAYWAWPAILRGVGIVWRHGVDAIYTTSWPFSDHIAGLVIGWLTRRPVIADFRDPWSQHMLYGARSTRVDRIQRCLERLVCRQASYVITPTFEATRAMHRIMPGQPRHKFATIRNGYDPSDFAGQIAQSERFEIVHTGTFYRTRQPDVLIAGFSQFLNRVPEAATNARLRLFGTSLDGDLSKFAAAKNVEVHGWTAHGDIVRAIRESRVLLLIGHFAKGIELTVPGKAYEYMATGNHILAIQDRQRELGRILRAYGNTSIVQEYQPQTVAETLEGLYRRWQAGELQTKQPPAFVQRFSRIEASRRLADLLERACPRRKWRVSKVSVESWMDTNPCIGGI